MKKKIWRVLLALVVLAGFLSFGIRQFQPPIPKVWDMERLRSMHLPLPNSTVQPEFISEDYYNQITERVAYKTYPFYMPGKEPPGYYEWLRTQEPQVVFNAADLKTEEDWIKAGEIIYDLPQTFRLMDSAFIGGLPLLAKYMEQFHVKTTSKGIIPFVSIIVRAKGRIELGTQACNTCHSKLMPDGNLLKGAQGNFHLSALARPLFRIQRDLNHVPDSVTTRSINTLTRVLVGAPWIKHETQDRFQNLNIDEWLDNKDLFYGTDFRQGTALGYPASIPDLFNMQQRKYFDHTGTSMQRDIGDLMRYATLNQAAELLNNYNGFTPADKPADPKKVVVGRFTDAQLYALAKFIYSLKSPKNPTVYPKALLKKGEGIFMKEGCDNCHNPPYYSNNKLTPADGFEPPAEHYKKYDIYDVPVGTDPVNALYTRRSSGYYKVPSLIGAWNRTAFLHNGNLANLEDMFDSTRFSPNYVPTGYKPTWVTHMAVPGHPYGTQLNSKDREALVAFIKSL
jgi:hypothetical protein